MADGTTEPLTLPGAGSVVEVYGKTLRASGAESGVVDPVETSNGVLCVPGHANFSALRVLWDGGVAVAGARSC